MWLPFAVCNAGKPGLHNSSECSGQCSSLGPQEWLALAGFWRAEIHSSTGSTTASELVPVVVLEAKQATFLKKSVEQSNLLPPSLVTAVPKGFRCTVAAAGRKYQDYWLCYI